ncbi:MAG: C-GCAxxG-C-C family protein [Bacteroidales bacterium]|jgi:C_GCAxxG_C_C family probable redox protein|nr:C-GCAxxG-C-C family protein [Bacteroidales bacterium]
MDESKLALDMSKPQKAIKAFRKGYNCAQSVLSVYADELQFDKDLSMEIASGFGAGMGRIQETCGAVTGAFMVIGIYNSKKYTDQARGREESIHMIQDFNEQFVELHASTKCRDLLKCDLKTTAGQHYFATNKLSEKVCEKCVANAVEIIENLK